MMDDYTELLAAIRAREAAATPGPWDIYRYRHGGGRICIDDAEQVDRRRELIADMVGDDPEAIATIYNEGDREFLVAARQDIPTLLAMVADLQQRIDNALDEHGHADTCSMMLSPDAGYDCTCWRAALTATETSEQ